MEVSAVKLRCTSPYDGTRYDGVYRWDGPTYTVWIHKLGKRKWEVYSGDRGRGDILYFKTLREVRSHIAEKGDQF